MGWVASFICQGCWYGVWPQVSSVRDVGMGVGSNFHLLVMLMLGGQPVSAVRDVGMGCGHQFHLSLCCYGSDADEDGYDAMRMSRELIDCSGD